MAQGMTQSEVAAALGLASEGLQGALNQPAEEIAKKGAGHGQR